MTSPQGGVQLGSAYGQIVIGNNIDTALTNAQRSFDNALSAIGGRMEQLGGQMQRVGTQLSILTAPLTIFGVQGVRAAASYEDAMKEIEVRAGLTAEQLDMVAQKTRDIGLASQYGPREAADAFLQLLTSGSSVEEAMIQIDAVIAGASASGAELGYTADALTDIMAALGLEAGESAAVMQTLINATGASSATFTDLVMGFQNIGPMARNMGLSVEETAATLAVFSENGIKGAEAGTQLRSMLNNMTRSTEDVVGMWQQLGVSLYDTEGNMRNLDDIIDDLNVAMDGMSDEERNNVITTLAGSYGQLGLSALLASGGIDEMQASMGDQADMSDVAASRLETFNGAIAFLRGSIELLQIDALGPLMDEYLRPMVLQIAEVVNSIRDWMVQNPELAGQIVRVLAVIAALGPVLVVVGTAMSALAPIISGIGLLLGALMSPIGLVIAAVAALAAAFVADFGGIRTAVETAIGPVLEAIGGFISGLQTAFEEGGVSGALSYVGNVFSGMVQRIGEIDWSSVGTSILNAVGTAFTTLVNLATWAYETFLQPVFEGLAARVQEIDWSSVGTSILDAVGTAFTTLVDLATWAYDHFLAPVFNGLVARVQEIDWGQVGTDIMSAIGTALTLAFDFLGWVNDNVLQPLLNNAASAIENVDWFAVGEGIINAIGTGIQMAFDFVSWIVSSIFGPITDNASTAADESELGSIFDVIMGAIGNVLQGGFDFIVWLVENVLSPLVAGAASAISQIDWGAIGTGIMDAIGNAIPNIGQWVQNHIITPIQNALSGFDPLAGIGVGGPVVDVDNVSGGGGLMAVPGMATGINYLPEDMLIQGHAGEAIIPAAHNPYNPDAPKSGGGMGGMTVTIQNINASGRAEGQAAGEAFGDAFMQRLREGGWNG